MDTYLEILLETLKSHHIEILSITGNHVKLAGNYEVEVEPNGMYKLFDDGYVVAPFNDAKQLCKLILT